jgi:ABC-2 type transport system permease protein
MPGWLHRVTDANPVSHLVTATRALMAGTVTTALVLWVLAAAGLLIAIFALLYQQK